MEDQDSSPPPNRRSRRICAMTAETAPPLPNKRRRITPAIKAARAKDEEERRKIAQEKKQREKEAEGERKKMALEEMRKARATEPESSDLSCAFPLMRLPAELRVHIYRMALCPDESILLHLPHKPKDESEDELAASRKRVRFRASQAHLITRPAYNINVALLRTSQLIYKEARQVLYSENKFILSIESGTYTLSTLHQRNRSLIKHVSLAIPSHHDILDCFADVVRLGLRYCWGLKLLTITLPTSFRGDDAGITPGTTNVYANAFHILRWLPKGCQIRIEGNVSDSIRKVVADEGRLLYVLDEKEYLKRQHQMPERH